MPGQTKLTQPTPVSIEDMLREKPKGQHISLDGILQIDQGMNTPSVAPVGMAPAPGLDLPFNFNVRPPPGLEDYAEEVSQQRRAQTMVAPKVPGAQSPYNAVAAARAALANAAAFSPPVRGHTEHGGSVSPQRQRQNFVGCEAGSLGVETATDGLTAAAMAMALGCGGGPASPTKKARNPQVLCLDEVLNGPTPNVHSGKTGLMLPLATMLPPDPVLSTTAPGPSPNNSSSVRLNLELLTFGSEGHDSGTCKPCAFFHSKGCDNGSECAFCHVCGPTEKKRRQRDKVSRREGRRGFHMGDFTPMQSNYNSDAPSPQESPSAVSFYRLQL